MDSVVNKWEVVDAWKDKFDKTGEDIFDIIENAIRVATRYRPAGLLHKRGFIGELLFAKFYEDDHSDILEEGEKEAEETAKEISPVSGKNDKAAKGEKVVDQICGKRQLIIRIKRKARADVVPKRDTVHKEKVTKITEQKRSEVKLNEKKVALSALKLIPQQGTVEKNMRMEKAEKIMGKEKVEDNVKKQVLKFAATKRRLEEKYREIELSRKKIRVIELKDLPPTVLGNRCKKAVAHNVKNRFIRC